MKNLTPWLDGHGGDRHDTLLIVMHATAGGSLEGAIETLRDRNLSYHYIIDRDGTVTKCIPLAKTAWHAGNSYGPDEEAKKISRKQDRSHNFVAKTCVNGYSIGISFVNKDDGKQTETPAQQIAAVSLILELRQAFPSLKFVTSHAIVSPGRKVDPLGYNMDALAKAVGLPLWRPS